MYGMFAYVGGSWDFVGIDPHEECAVLFISSADKLFGEGTAFVCKLPDKTLSDEDMKAHTDMSSLLDALNEGKLDLNEALAEFNENENKNKN